jgi:2-polyprenyl-3-methyl-5-hydroxy-6-metoxy-1,4-benzoquinol methylase
MSKKQSAAVAPEFFDTAYDQTPPWEIGRPQEDIVRLCDRNGFKGQVLDLGCGTGENALYLASNGLSVKGIDRVAAAIERAKAKAATRKLEVPFEVRDALTLKGYGQKFDTVLDSGLFHVFSDADRKIYAEILAELVKHRGVLHILCFSDLEPGSDGPRRVGERELIELFNMRGWLVEEVSEARFETLIHPDGARAWLATFARHG